METVNSIKQKSNDFKSYRLSNNRAAGVTSMRHSDQNSVHIAGLLTPEMIMINR